MRDLPGGCGLGKFFWEPSQRGAWDNSMFDWTDNTTRANSGDFAKFDALKTELGLYPAGARSPRGGPSGCVSPCADDRDRDIPPLWTAA
jgi:hypothetical protein